MNLTVGVFGDPEFIKELGKEGTTNDIAIYNHSSSEGIFTYVRNNSDKIQSLLQSIAMADVPVIVINELGAEVGEIILAVDAFGFSCGFVLLGENVAREQVMPLVSGTSVARFEFLAKDSVELRSKLCALDFKDISGDAKVVVDNYFQVKSVGTVILGLVKRGSVKEYDKLMVEPLGKEILVKSIQSHGKNIKIAGTYVRVGLSVKGIDVDSLKRGCVVCPSGSLSVSDTFEIEFSKNPFFKGDVSVGKTLFFCCGLQVVTATIEEVSDGRIKFKCERKIAFEKSDKFIVASTGQEKLRIIGSGSVV